MDAGLSGKKTKQLLDEVGIDINEIDMAFLSHDHTDHSGGLGVERGNIYLIPIRSENYLQNK